MLGFYSTVPAPGTNKEVLDTIYNKFGIALPLEDLFRWGDGTHADRIQALKSAYEVGSATIDEVRDRSFDTERWMWTGKSGSKRAISHCLARS